MRSRAPRRGRNAPTGELDEAAAVEAWSLDDGGIDDPDAEVPLQATGGADVQAAGSEATIARASARTLSAENQNHGAVFLIL